MCSRGIKSTGFASGALGVGVVHLVSMRSLFNNVAKVSGVVGSGTLALSGAVSSLAWSVFIIVSSRIILCCSGVYLADPGAGTVGGGPEGLLGGWFLYN